MLKKIAIAAYLAALLVTRVTPVDIVAAYNGMAHVLYNDGIKDVTPVGHVTAHGIVKLVTVSGQPVLCFK